MNRTNLKGLSGACLVACALISLVPTPSAGPSAGALGSAAPVHPGPAPASPVARPLALAPTERAELARAQQSDPGLAEQRAGGFSDRQIVTGACVLLGVIALVLLL